MLLKEYLKETDHCKMSDILKVLLVFTNGLLPVDASLKNVAVQGIGTFIDS